MTNQTSTTGTQNVWPYYAKGNLQAAGNKSGKDLGKDEFLHILITQLKNQDPMQPLQDREFIAQMAQFSTVEQVMNMGKELTMLRQSLGLTSGLIGNSITWNLYSPDGQISGMKAGIVDAVVMRDGQQYLQSGIEEIAMDAVVKIQQGEESAQ